MEKKKNSTWVVVLFFLVVFGVAGFISYKGGYVVGKFLGERQQIENR
ncbi:hypothetical protein [Nitritalea halalkaliphila]|nr:hypothetical protein [Nitritalea halalkaliphila]